VWQKSGTAVKDRGSHDLASEFGAQKACFEAQVHWDRKDSNPITTLFDSLLPSCNFCFFYTNGALLFSIDLDPACM